MSRFFPHPSYAEDQPYAKTILTTHVLTRGLTTGAVIGGMLFGGRALFPRSTSSPPSAAAAVSKSDMKTTTTSQARSPPSPLLARRLVRGVGISTLWTLAFVGVGLGARMWGREDIEWKDRSWRLLENKGQLECDDWTYAGMAVGVVTASAAVMVGSRGRKGVVPLVALGGGSGPVGSGGGRAVEVLGTASLGSFAGMLGYMTWRYGVHGGKFPSE